MTTDIELKIINATIECIEKYGIQRATNRRIAEMAKVNSASINYYFRSKDILIAQTLSITLDNAFDFDNFESHPEDSPAQRCITIFNDLITGGLMYPGITRAHFYPVLVEGKYSHEVVTRLNHFAQPAHRRSCHPRLLPPTGRFAAGCRTVYPLGHDGDHLPIPLFQRVTA